MYLYIHGYVEKYHICGLKVGVRILHFTWVFMVLEFNVPVFDAESRLNETSHERCSNITWTCDTCVIQYADISAQNQIDLIFVCFWLHVCLDRQFCVMKCRVWFKVTVNGALGLIHTGRATRRTCKKEHFSFDVIACSVNTPIDNRSHLLALHCAWRPVWIRPQVGCNEALSVVKPRSAFCHTA